MNEPYIGGEVIKGVIDVGCTREVRIGGLLVRLTGVAETGWRNKNSDLSFESRHNFMDELIDLTTSIADHCTEEFYLLEGRHSVSFEARLPMDVLSSIDRDNYGSVRYTCTALMAIPEDGDTEMVAEKTFKVYPYLNLDAPYMRDAAATTEEELITGCCGRKRGSIVASMKVQEVGLLPGETTRITLTVEDRTRRKRWQRKKGQHECVLISLCQQLDFVSTNRYETDLVDRKSVTIAVESHGTCKARPGSGPETKEIEFSVPSDLPPTSIHADRLVTISYFFKLDLDQFDIIVPVIIGTSKTPGKLE
ncbi:arrestin domain protein [Ancylostoma ceylanicum]|nr:arrestin domain protein [Ancylostoma ceylanicum]